MMNWLNSALEDLAALPAALWFVLGGIVLLAAALPILAKKNAPRWALVSCGVLLLAGAVAAAALILPHTEADLESGGTTAAAWLYSPAFWTAVLCVLGLVLLVLLLRRTRWTVRMLSTGALCIAASFILDCITLYHLPQGGGIRPAAMLPVLFYAWVYGVGPGIAAGVAHGLLTMVTGVYVIHPLQFLLDYIFPFAALGLAGLFRGENKLPAAMIFACFVRFLMHFLSGWIYFGSYAPVGQSAILYSFLYNGGYMLINTLICVAVALIPPVKRVLLRLRRKCLADSEKESEKQI